MQKILQNNKSPGFLTLQKILKKCFAKTLISIFKKPAMKHTNLIRKNPNNADGKTNAEWKKIKWLEGLCNVMSMLLSEQEMSTNCA
jgi:hypothetical protein